MPFLFRKTVLLWLLGLTFLSGCSTSGDLASNLLADARGNVPIPSETLSIMKKKGMEPTDPVLVRIFKMESELEVWKRDKTGNFALLKTYPMCRWSGNLGPKTEEGDRQAPEGFYAVNVGQLNPRSQYFLSFDLGFPNRLERAKGYTGAALMVHGACSSSGCYAISDQHVAELYAVVRDALRGGQAGFQVQAYPFRMTPENLAAYNANTNFEFWMDLKEGSDRFEVLRQPPSFGFCDGRYRFGTPTDGKWPSDPLGACPEFDAAPEAVTAKAAADLAKIQSLIDDGPKAAHAYVDGGMHPDFRKILAEEGPEHLSRKTSSMSVPVSRPRAALADPYITGNAPFKASAIAER